MVSKTVHTTTEKGAQDDSERVHVVPSNKTKKQDYEQDEHFDTFWNVYPRKTNKQGAKKAWDKIKPDEMLTASIMLALVKQEKSDQWAKDNGKFIPHASTWLNQERWNDEMPGKAVRKPSRFDRVESTNA